MSGWMTVAVAITSVGILLIFLGLRPLGCGLVIAGCSAWLGAYYFATEMAKAMNVDISDAISNAGTLQWFTWSAGGICLLYLLLLGKAKKHG